MQKKAIVLFSGGLDSTTCLAIAKSQGNECFALSFYYGQRHEIEIQAAKKIADMYGVSEHKILTLPLGEIKGSSLTDKSIAVPDYHESNNVPNTYVPARNTIFLSFALAWAEVIGAYDIFMGANYADYSGYPDCRPDYLEAFEKMAALATMKGAEGQQYKIHAPLLYLTKADIVKTGMGLGVNYGQTISCYRADKDGKACGNCDSCTYRKKGFADAGMEDPTPYTI
jgi:7-cyano-7-deazaguanine synthase